MKRQQRAEAVSRHLLEELDREVRSHGRGSIRTLERALDQHTGWWQRRVEAGSLPLPQFVAVLDHLGLDAGRFLTRIRDSDSDLALDRPWGDPPEVVTRALARFSAHEPGTKLRHDYLDTLDEGRFRRPEEVVDQVAWAVDHIEPELVPRLLGVVASAWRFLNALDKAEHAIHAGIRFSERKGDHSTVADLLQRLGYVVADRGEHREALRLAEKAALLYLRSSDRSGFHKALVDQGIWLSRLYRPEEAVAMEEAALSGLPSTMQRNRCAAHQVIALNLRRLGRPADALSHIETALRYASPFGPLFEGKLVWLTGSVYNDLGQLEEAEARITEAIDSLRTAHLGETVLATCDLVALKLQRDRPDSAYQTAASLRTLLDLPRINPVISSAIAELLRQGRTGITPALIRRVKAQIEQERARRRSLWLELQVK